MNDTQAVVQAPSPETVRAFLAAPVDLSGPDTSTVGEVLSLLLLDVLREGFQFAAWKCAIYKAGIRAGVIPGTVSQDGRLTEVSTPEAVILAEAAIRYMGKPPADTTAALREMIAAKRLAIADAGISRGLSPDWHEPTFTAAEIEAVLAGAGA